MADNLAPVLTEDQVHVWYALPERATDSSLAEGYLALLSADERDRHARFVFAADRQRYLVARVLVRATLSRYADVTPGDWIFASAHGGRPEIAGPPGAPRLRFSLSHTRGLVAIAIAAHANVGLDVEELVDRRDNLEIARRYFAASEADELEALSGEQRARAFLEYWTLKEAYAKATGLGMSIPLQDVVFRRTTPPVASFAPARREDGSTWHFSRLDLSLRHVAALATQHPRRPAIAIRETIPLV